MLLPPSTNADYRGSPWAPRFLVLVGLVTVVPGFIHYFLPDGGAGVIAGLDLSRQPALIIGMFAWMGATQIAWGLAELFVAFRYRTLTPLFLLLALIKDVMASVSAWITKPGLIGHHPPENYGVLVGVPLLVIFLWLSLRSTGRQRSSQPTTRTAMSASGRQC